MDRLLRSRDDFVLNALRFVCTCNEACAKALKLACNCATCIYHLKLGGFALRLRALDVAFVRVKQRNGDRDTGYNAGIIGIVEAASAQTDCRRWNCVRFLKLDAGCCGVALGFQKSDLNAESLSVGDRNNFLKPG